VLATAAAQPDRLVIGVDANAAAMAEAARRAGSKPSRGGLPNALFVTAAVAAMPAELDSAADLVTVHFPWGSLLRGLVSTEPATMTGVTRIMRPGAGLTLLLSATERDRGLGLEPIGDHTMAALRDAYASWQLAVTEIRPATLSDVKAAHSSWAKRLGAAHKRPAWLLRATKCSS
jgi:16S rRNA (adenine(1408)-N(1))-methyltransferase